MFCELRKNASSFFTNAPDELPALLAARSVIKPVNQLRSDAPLSREKFSGAKAAIRSLTVENS
jgi:hypothetical protein